MDLWCFCEDVAAEDCKRPKSCGDTQDRTAFATGWLRDREYHRHPKPC